MDPESKKLLEDTFRLTEENNQMLRKVRSVQKRGTFWSLFKWIVILGVTFGSFYFLQPYIEKVMNVWGSLSGQQNTINSFQSFLKGTEETPR